jgi:hypothetical protein
MLFHVQLSIVFPKEKIIADVSKGEAGTDMQALHVDGPEWPKPIGRLRRAAAKAWEQPRPGRPAMARRRSVSAREVATHDMGAALEGKKEGRQRESSPGAMMERGRWTVAALTDGRGRVAEVRWDAVNMAGAVARHEVDRDGDERRPEVVGVVAARVVRWRWHFGGGLRKWSCGWRAESGSGADGGGCIVQWWLRRWWWLAEVRSDGRTRGFMVEMVFSGWRREVEWMPGCGAAWQSR